MSFDFGTLQVSRLIIHEIPRRTVDQSGELRVTNKECPLQQKDKNFFAERIKESLSKSQYQAKFKFDTNSPVPNYIFKILSNKLNKEDEFILTSQSIARHLYNCQKGNNPAGVLLIAQVKVLNKPSLAILKLENEEGIQYESEEKDDLLTYNIKQLSNLMMTGGKVFKAGLFVRDSEEISSIKGYISDKQKGIKSNTEIAKFFLEDFLGCDLIDSPELMTKEFFKTSQNFINNQVEDPELKAKYEIALLSTIQNNNSVVEPVNFAQLHLKLEHRQSFLNALTNNNVPIQSFEKDTNSIKNNIKTINFSFGKDGSRLLLSATPDFFDNGIDIKPASNNKVKVTFEAELERIGK